MKLAKTGIVEEFSRLVNQGAECWIKAGEILADEWRVNPEVVDEICDKVPHMTEERVNCFIQMGLKRLHPDMLLSDGPGIRRLRKLPYALQEKYSSELIEVWIGPADKTLMVDVRNLTARQARQVFSPDGSIRTVAAQRAYAESAREGEAAPSDSHGPKPEALG